MHRGLPAPVPQPPGAPTFRPQANETGDACSRVASTSVGGPGGRVQQARTPGRSKG